MNADYLRWLSGWVTETASLVFLWDGSLGNQPVLMPGDKYFWWIDGDSHTDMVQPYRWN